MVTQKKSQPPDAQSSPVARACTVVDGCSGEAVLQAERSCDSCGGESSNLRANAQRRRAELEQLDQADEQVKERARARVGACGCGDPSSHDGSPQVSATRPKKAEDFVTAPQPCPRPQSGDLTELEVLDLRISAQRRQQLGEEIEHLDAAVGRVAKEHTHPVFACSKHVRRLPK